MGPAATAPARASGSERDQQRQQRVAPAGERDPDRAEGADLPVVVGDAHREHVEQLVEQLVARGRGAGLGRGEEERRPGGRRRVAEARAVDAAAADLDHRQLPRIGAAQLLEIGAPGGRLAPAARGAIEIDDRGGHPLDEARGLHDGAAVLVHEAAAVEHQVVVAADQVGVDDGRLVVGGAGRDHLPPGRQHAGPRVAAAPHRPVGGPDVLAHLEADDTEVEAEDLVAERRAVGLHRPERGAPGVGAGLVEDVVGGQLLLGDEADQPPAVDHRRHVVQIAADAHREADGERGAEPGGGGGEALEALPLGVDVALPLDQILRRVAADHLLGEHRERHLVGREALSQLDAAIDVGARGAHRRVDVGDADLDQPHGNFASASREGPGISRTASRSRRGSGADRSGPG